MKKILFAGLMIFVVMLLVGSLFAIPTWCERLSDREIVSGKVVYISPPTTRHFEVQNLKDTSVQYVTVLIETTTLEGNHEYILLESHDGIERNGVKYEYTDSQENYRLISSLKPGEQYSFILNSPTLGGKYQKIVSCDVSQ